MIATSQRKRSEAVARPETTLKVKPGPTMSVKTTTKRKRAMKKITIPKKTPLMKTSMEVCHSNNPLAQVRLF